MCVCVKTEGSILHQVSQSDGTVKLQSSLNHNDDTKKKKNPTWNLSLSNNSCQDAVEPGTYHVMASLYISYHIQTIGSCMKTLNYLYCQTWTNYQTNSVTSCFKIRLFFLAAALFTTLIDFHFPFHFVLFYSSVCCFIEIYSTLFQLWCFQICFINKLDSTGLEPQERHHFNIWNMKEKFLQTPANARSFSFAWTFV